MRYTYISFILWISCINFITLHAEENKIDADNSKPSPAVLEMPDSIFSVELHPVQENNSEYETPFKIVEDTILPPCDVIFFKSGKLEYCKIIETNPTSISYKMCDYVDGPTVIVNKSTVQKIRYANGKEEIIIAEKVAPINAYVRPPKDKLATLSLIFGLSSIAIALLIGIVFIPLVLAGIVLGIISIVKISRRRGELRGKGAAITGVLLCALVLLLLAL